MPGTDAVAALLKAELYQEIKRFIEGRDRRCKAGDPRYGVALDALMALKLKYGSLSLEHLEMIGAICRNSVPAVIRWMNSRRPDLDHRRPVDLILTGEGAARVEREIEKLFETW